MNSFLKSTRLRAISECLIPGLEVWDTCCDHGYLGRWALAQGQFSNVHFVDQVPDIIAKLESQISLEGPKRSKLFPKPKTNVNYHSIDLARINQEIQGNLVICGVGAFKIKEILLSLSQGPFLNAKRIILGPQKNPDLLSGMNLTGYQLSKEIALAEKGRERILLVYDRN